MSIKPYGIYLSSTLSDLAEERRNVMDVLTTAGFAVKQSYEASEDSLIQSCVDDVAKCQVYVAIIAMRYGYCPPVGTGTKSITEMEYERACQANMPCYIFMIDEGNVRSKFNDVNTEQNEDGERIRRFRQRLSEAHRPAIFEDVRGLREAVLHKLSDFRRHVEGTQLHDVINFRLCIEGAQPLLENMSVVLPYPFPPPWACEWEEDAERGLAATLSLNAVRQTFRWIQPGTFLMSFPPAEVERFDNQTHHAVTLTCGYWLADTYCSQALWTMVMGDNPGFFKGDSSSSVAQVSRDEVQTFLALLNDLVPGLDAGLPSSVQLEHASQVGTNTLVSSGENITLEHVNYHGNKLDEAWHGRLLRNKLAESDLSSHAQASRADELSSLAARLSEQDDWQEALAPAREAVEIYRDLAARHPDAFRPDLASSLINLCGVLYALDELQGALAPAREAVEIYRDLAARNPDAFRLNLASSLECLIELGDLQRALASAREAVEIYRDLAVRQPDAFRPYLARVLYDLADCLIELGDLKGALAPAREAVEICRNMAVRNPDNYHDADVYSELAKALSTLAIRLSEMGDRQEALAPAREAVAIYRDLAVRNPDDFLPDLGTSLNLLAIFLSEAGDWQGAVTPAREAVEIHCELAAKNPDIFRPDLVGWLNNVANEVSEGGDQQEALALARSTMEIYRALLAAKPSDVFRL